MIGFLIKKNFFDAWDNFFKIALLNIGFLLSLAFPVFVPGLFASVPFLGTGFLLVGILWCFVYISAAAKTLKSISDYGSFTFADFIEKFKTNWLAGLFFGGLIFALYMLCVTAIPFYLSMKSAGGLLLAALVFWAAVTAVLALQFFFAVLSRLETKFFRAIKKCFLLLLFDPLFCVFSLFHNLFILVISVFPLFLFVPGPMGILLFLDEGLRLRLMKYDWLEANPEADKRKIPWDAILIEEREKTGSRSFKNFIFPWKD